MNRVEFTVIHKSDKITKMARAFDVFEEGKICGIIQKFHLDYKEGEDISWDRVKKVMKVMSSQDEVVFAHAESIQTDEMILFNKEHVKPYIAKDVRVVSDGYKFFLLSDFLKAKKISHTVTEHMYVRGADK